MTQLRLSRRVGDGCLGLVGESNNLGFPDVQVQAWLISHHHEIMCLANWQTELVKGGLRMAICWCTIDRIRNFFVSQVSRLCKGGLCKAATIKTINCSSAFNTNDYFRNPKYVYVVYCPLAIELAHFDGHLNTTSTKRWVQQCTKICAW